MATYKQTTYCLNSKEGLIDSQTHFQDPSEDSDGYEIHDSSSETPIDPPSNPSLYSLYDHPANQATSSDYHRPEMATNDEEMAVTSNQTSSCKDKNSEVVDKKSQLIKWKRYSENATKENTTRTFLFTLQALTVQFQNPVEAAAHIENTLSLNIVYLNRHNYEALDATIKILTGKSCIQFYHHIGDAGCRIGIIPNMREFDIFISFYHRFLDQLYPLVGSIRCQYQQTHKTSMYVMKFSSVEHMWQIIHFLYYTIHAKIFMLDATIEYCFDTSSDFYFDEHYITKVIYDSVITYELFVRKGGYLTQVIANLLLCCVKQRCKLTCKIDTLIDRLKDTESYLPNLYPQLATVKMSNPDIRQVMINQNLFESSENKALVCDILN